MTARRDEEISDEQIAGALKQAETGTPVEEVVRKMGIPEQTFYPWKKKFNGMLPGGVRRFRRLEEENRRLKLMVADLSPDRHLLREVLAKKDRNPLGNGSSWTIHEKTPE